VTIRVTLTDIMLVPTSRPVKRQSFSIESLAISSHAEPARETSSPPLHFPVNASATSRNMDRNANVVENQRWEEYQQTYNVYTSNLKINEDNETSFLGTQQLPDVATSTPLPNVKRPRSLCISTSPSSDESTSDDHMVTDDSSELSFPGVEKFSNTSASNCSNLSGMMFLKLIDIELSLILGHN